MSGYAALLSFHIVVGTVGLLLGPVLFRADWQRWRQARDLGMVYLTMVAAVCVSAVALVVIRRHDLWWLIPVSALTFALGVLGRYAVERGGSWSHAYVHGLGGSYIALITATVVVSFAIDGPLYGIWQLVAWVGPTVVGVPVLEWWRKKLLSRGSYAQGSSSGMRRA